MCLNYVPRDKCASLVVENQGDRNVLNAVVMNSVFDLKVKYVKMSTEHCHYTIKVKKVADLSELREVNFCMCVRGFRGGRDVDGQNGAIGSRGIGMLPLKNPLIEISFGLNIYKYSMI